MLLLAASEQDSVFSGRAWLIRAWLLADQPDNEPIIAEILQQAGISAGHAVYGPVLEHAARTTTAAHRNETM